MRIDLEVMSLQVFFHRKMCKAEKIQAFVQNEEVLANFQQISCPHSCAIGGNSPEPLVSTVTASSNVFNCNGSYEY